ncbi:MAG: ACT domain-containing protein [Desulfobacterales bacterium]
MTGHRLEVMSSTMGICRLEAGQTVPRWAARAGFFSITATSDEVSVVCPEPSIPEGVVCSRGWRALKVKGPLDFSKVGVLAALAGPLARAKISIFVISTYDTDILMVRSADLHKAVDVLVEAGHRVDG